MLETPQANLSRAIQWLNASYATWYNPQQGRGHLFQGRFKAVLIEADSYLIVLSRYIHLNPVRAGRVGAPEAYSWSSASIFLGERQAPEWLEIDRVLSGFHSNRDLAVGLARELCGLSGCDLGCYFGGVTGAAVTLVGKKFEREVAKDQELREKVTRVRKALRFKM